LAAEYRDAAADPKTADETHQEIAAEMAESINMADRAAVKIAGFVRGIKFQTRDLAARDAIAFDPVAVIQDALLLLGPGLRDARVPAEFKPPANVPRLYGAPGRLAQVVTNLVTNAVDASRPKGGGKIRIEVRPDQEDRVLLSVTDSGVGIRPEVA